MESKISIPTEEEIAAKIVERTPKDIFGFEIEDYISYLSYEQAKPFIKEGISKEEFNAVKKEHTRDNVLAQAKDYISFAFDKANNKKGLSASRSIHHFIAWTWLAGDRDFSKQIEEEYETNYDYYGKNILRTICEYYGWNWQSLDDGILESG